MRFTPALDALGVSNMLMEDSYISVGDDTIAIKSGLNWAVSWVTNAAAHSTACAAFHPCRVCPRVAMYSGPNRSAHLHRLLHNFIAGTNLRQANTKCE